MPYKNVKVIQKNSTPFLATAGQTLPVPCGASYELQGEFWAVPIKDNGVFRGYDYKPGTLAQPTFDSFKVTRIKDRDSVNDTYWVAASLTNVLAAINDCAAITESTIPAVIPEVNGDTADGTNYAYIWGVPSKVASDEFKAQVAIDNVLQATPPATGHTDLAAMVTWLNANVPAAGTWSAVSGRLKLVNTTNKKVGVLITVGNFA